MKRFLTTTAVAVTIGTAGFADTAMMDWTSEIAQSSDQFYGSELIGMRVHRAEQDYATGDTITSGTADGWDDIGEINDLVISSDGQVEAVILGIGGFLGIGERDVAVQMDAIRVVSNRDDLDDRYLIVAASRADLETIPEFERRDPRGVVAMKEAAELQADAADPDAMKDADAPATEMALNRPQIERDGYDELKMASVSEVDAIIGTAVFDVNDQHIGEVSDVLVEKDSLTDAVIDVGGFLGLGEKPVAVSFDELQLLRNVESEELRIYIDRSQDALEKMPEYSGS